MKLYSDFPMQRTGQIVFDIFALTTIAIGVGFGVFVSSAIGALAEVGFELEKAGAGFKDVMTQAGDALGGVPFVGDAVREPFDNAKGTGHALEQAGQTTQYVIANTAMVSGIVAGGSVVVAVCLLWLLIRLRFARRATEAIRIAKLDDGMDVLALRAFVNGSSKSLAAAGPHAFETWRNGNRAAIERLAELELREVGVRFTR